MEQDRFNKVIISLLLMCGIALSIYGFVLIGRAARSKGWSPVEGKIIDSSTMPLIEDVPKNKFHDHIIPHIVYEYTVREQTYFCNALTVLSHSYFEISDTFFAGNEDETNALLDV